MNKIKVGLVGCGFIAKGRHIPAFLRLKDRLSLSAVCDVNKSMASEVAKNYHIPKSYSNFSDMLKNEDLDLVDICTPPLTHSKLAIEAIENDVNVLVEKPMAPTVSECDQMIKFADKKDVKLCVVHNEIFYPPILRARKLIEGGTVGKLISMRWCRLGHRNSYMSSEGHWVHKLPGGLIGEVGPHAVYTSLFFLDGVKNVDVYARKSLDYPWVLFDEYRVELEGNEVNSSIFISHVNKYRLAEIDLFCTDQAIKIDSQSMIMTLYDRKDITSTSLVSSTLKGVSQTIKGVISNSVLSLLGKTFIGHFILTEKFVDSIIRDEPSPVSGEQGKQTISVMEKIVNNLKY